MTTVNDVLQYLEQLAPRELKMDWDNVGLLCGSRRRSVKTVLVALDPFEGVCAEAEQIGAQLLVTHHPLIFHAPKSVTDDTSVGRCIMQLCRSGISAVNAHTNLDCADGGVNDILAATLGLQNVRVIGNEHLLRAGETAPMPLSEFLAQVMEKLGCDGLRYTDGGKTVQCVAVGGGACASDMAQAVSAGCDTFVTSDIRYNQFWDAHDVGLNLIDAGHFCTENPIVAVLAEKLRAAFPELRVEISKTHKDCMKFYR